MEEFNRGAQHEVLLRKEGAATEIYKLKASFYWQGEVEDSTQFTQRRRVLAKLCVSYPH